MERSLIASTTIDLPRANQAFSSQMCDDLYNVAFLRAWAIKKNRFVF